MGGGSHTEMVRELGGQMNKAQDIECQLIGQKGEQLFISQTGKSQVNNEGFSMISRQYA